MEGCKIQTLDINFILPAYEDLNEYEDCLMKIFVAIIHWSNLIRNLKRIRFRWSNNMGKLLLEKAKEELNDIGYRSVKLILETSEKMNFFWLNRFNPISIE